MELALTAFIVSAVVAFAVYSLVAAWRKVMRDKSSLPLYGMLERKGLTAVEAGDALGVETLAHAARRCAYCRSGEECQQRVAAGEPPPAECPNADLFAELARPRV